MAIHIINPDPDIFITQDEHDRLWADYQRMCMFMVDPPPFERYVRDHRTGKYGSGPTVGDPLRDRGNTIC